MISHIEGLSNRKRAFTCVSLKPMVGIYNNGHGLLQRCNTRHIVQHVTLYMYLSHGIVNLIETDQTWWKRATVCTIKRFYCIFKISLLFLGVLCYSNNLKICIISEATKTRKQLSLGTRWSLFYLVVQKSRLDVVGQKEKSCKLWMETGKFCPHLDSFCHDTKPGERGAWPLTDC